MESEYRQEEKEGNLKDQDRRENDRKCCPRINGNYLPPKLFYFFYFSALGALIPYLALYFKQMKLTPSQVGILMGLKPFVEFVCTPLWGAFVDRFKKGKSVLLLSLLVTALSQFSLSLVAPAERLCTMHLTERTIILYGQNSSNAFPSNGNSTIYWKDFVFVPSVVNTNPWPLVFLSTDETQAKESADVSDTAELFTILFVIIFLSNILSSPSLALADTVTMQTLRPNVELYGLQRLWGSVGWGISSFLIGALVTLSHYCPNPFTRPDEINYSPCFYSFGVLMLLTLLTSTRFSFVYNTEDANKQKSGGIIEGFRNSLSIKYAMFLFTVFYFGMLNAFMKTFLFWHLKDSGGTQLLFSFIAAINCFAEVSMYFVSDKIITWIGHTRVIYLASAGFAFRCLWYSFLQNPWLVLPMELMPGITNAMAWVAMLSYVNEMSTSDNATTHQGILYGFYRGLGYGGGEVLGGVMINFVGSANAFKIFGLGAAVTLLGNICVENFHRLKRT